MDNMKLILDRVPKSFSEGLFWGNGRMGCLMYTAGSRLCFSIDHINLWENRDTLGDNPEKDFCEILENPQEFLTGNPEYVRSTHIFHKEIGRTKLPGLNLELDLEAEITDFYAEKSLYDGNTQLKLITGTNREFSLEIYLDSNVNVLSMKLSRMPESIAFTGWDLDNPELWPLKRWNYQKYLLVNEDETTHIIQPFAKGGQAVISMLKKNDVQSQIFLSMDASLVGNADLQKSSNAKLLEDYSSNAEEYHRCHRQDWVRFWSASEIKVPSERLQQGYNLEMYKLYCNLRPDSVPVTLQGIWNTNSRMPAWYGDWHNDLNVQACYWPAYRTGHAEFAKAYINYYSACLPRFKDRAYKLFGLEDAAHVPVMMGPDGYGVASEWCFWNLLLGPELFVATDFSMYYEYTGNPDELKESIYPFIKAVLNLYKGIAVKKEDGFLHIPFTNTPEVFRDGKMLCLDDSTFTISTLHYLLERMSEYADLLGYESESKQWRFFGMELTPVTVTEKGLSLFPGVDVFESHRHFCHLYPIFPLETENHNELANKSLDAVVNMGFTEFASFSFPYMAMFASRCGRGNMAGMMEEIYALGFRSRNSFVVNGDPNRNGIFRISNTNAGESSDAFTLEAGFMFASALCDMFVHRSKNTVYLGAGIPDNWKSASCRGITLKGGHSVSLEIDNYEIVSASIESNRDEELSFVFYKSFKEPVTLLLKKGQNVRLI